MVKISLVRRILQYKKEHKADSYISSANFIIYGPTGKSSLVASLSEYGDEGTVLELTPAGGSSSLEGEYSNFISYPVQNLEELESVLISLNDDLTLIKKIQTINEKLKINPNDREALSNLELGKKAITAKGDNWDEVYAMACSGKLPIKAICLAEASVVSGWIMERVEKKMKVETIGTEKAKLGMDWSVLKQELRKFYVKLLGLPCTTIISSNEILPAEKQNLSSIIPNIAIGAFSRELIEMVGNVFMTTLEEGKMMVYINADNRKMLTKQKFKKVQSGKALLEKIDITSEPQKLWAYIDEVRNEDKK